jgi:hypothetical protein
MILLLSKTKAQIISGVLNAIRKHFLVATDYPYGNHSTDRSASKDFSAESHLQPARQNLSVAIGS